MSIEKICKVTRADPTEARLGMRRAFSTVCALMLSLISHLMAIAVAEAQLSTSGAEQITIGANRSAPNRGSAHPVIPPVGGDFVVFSSRATNLAGAFNGESSISENVFMYSPATGVRLISTTPSGTPPGKTFQGSDLALGAYAPSVSRSSNGAFAIAFASDAIDLVTSYMSPTNAATNPSQVYIYMKSATAERLDLVSFSYTGTTTGGNGDSDLPTVAMINESPVEYRVCFRSTSRDMGGTSPSGSPGPPTIFCRVVEDSPTIAPNNVEVLYPNITNEVSFNDLFLSGDGSVLAFSSNGRIVSTVTPNQYQQVYRYSFTGSQSTLVSRSANGGTAVGRSTSPSLSYTGSTVAFRYEPISPPSADGLKDFTGATSPVCVKYASSAYQQINANSSGAPSTGRCESSRIDASGVYAVFSDTGGNIVTPFGSSNGVPQVYLKNTETAEVLRLSVTTGSSPEPGNGPSGDVSDGVTLGSTSNDSLPYMAFASYAQSLASVGIPTSNNHFIFRSTIAQSGGSGGGSNGGGSNGGGSNGGNTGGGSEGGGSNGGSNEGGSNGGNTGGGSEGDTSGGSGGDSPSAPEEPRPPRTLTKNIKIEVPPEVRITNRSTDGLTDLEITLEEFTLDKSLFGRSIRVIKPSSHLMALASKAAKLRYHLEIKKAGSAKRITRILSRNTTTIRKLSPGRYTIRYKVVATKGKKTIQSRLSSGATVTLT